MVKTRKRLEFNVQAVLFFLGVLNKKARRAQKKQRFPKKENAEKR